MKERETEKESVCVREKHMQEEIHQWICKGEFFSILRTPKVRNGQRIGPWTQITNTRTSSEEVETEIDEDHQYKEQNRPYLNSTDIGRNILISDIGRNILITGSRIDKIIFEHTSLWRGVAEIQIRDRRSPRYKLRFIKITYLGHFNSDLVKFRLKSINNIYF